MQLSCIKYLAIASLVILAACGGRVARLVEPRSALDAQLSCDHMEAEFSTHLNRLRELSDERKRGTRDNVGILLMSPLFLNLSDTERKEAASLQERNKILLDLAEARQCTADVLQRPPAPQTTP